MIRMIVFDMAGTTVNENNVVYKTLRTAINEEGFDFTLEQVLAEGAGREKLEAIKNILRVIGHVDDSDLANRIYLNFTGLLSEAYNQLQVLPQNNAEELFRLLRRRNILIILNTGYDSTTAQGLISKLSWSKGIEFDELITASDVKNNRPLPDMILLAMEHHGITDVREILKLGDSTIDIEEGKNASCGLSIGITSGAHSRQQLQSANPDYIIDDLLQLIPILEKYSTLPRRKPN